MIEKLIDKLIEAARRLGQEQGRNPDSPAVQQRVDMLSMARQELMKGINNEDSR